MKYLSINLHKLFINLIIILPIVVGVWALFASPEAHANARDIPTIIGCIHSKSLITKLPKGGHCYYGKGWQNIMIPPKSHMDEWVKVFGSKQAIINRLPIVNFESGFTEYAGNHSAVGYVQTLRKWNISPKIIPQLEWMRDRQESQKKGNCSQWKNYGEERMMGCLYARHYGALSISHWYPQKALKTRLFYIEYFKKNGFNF